MNYYVLTKSLAEERCHEILAVHNLIPHQKWEQVNLIAEHDETRLFSDKWRLSTCTMNDTNSKIIGVCVAFFDVFENQRAVYIHRLAVDLKYRRQGIGSNLVYATLNNAKIILNTEDFIFFLKTQYENKGVTLYREEQAIDFYEAIGMHIHKRIVSIEKSEFIMVSSFSECYERSRNWGEVRCF